MPRFHFHTYDQNEVLDEDGFELVDIEAARKAAMIYASEVLKELAEEIYTTDLRVTVTNEAGLMLWDILVVATEAPAIRR